MGLPGWFPFLRKKGYEPSVIYQSAAPTTSSTATRRIDLISRFAVIRHAYTRNPIDKAHKILELDITWFGSKNNTVIYLDGSPAEEKTFTTEIRREARQKAIVRCEARVEDEYMLTTGKYNTQIIGTKILRGNDHYTSRGLPCIRGTFLIRFSACQLPSFLFNCMSKVETLFC